MNTILGQAQRSLIRRREALLSLLNQKRAEEHELHEAREPDWVDQAVKVEQGSVLTRLAEQEKRELEEIEAALARIAGGQFGRCEVCGGAIGRQRLRAIPEARMCMTCSSIRSR